MAFFVAVLKRIFCVGDDDDRSCSSLHANPKLNTSRFNSSSYSTSHFSTASTSTPRTSQFNSGVTSHYDPFLPCPTRLSGARDVVSGVGTYKPPSIPSMEASVSQNRTINSIKSEPPKNPPISTSSTTILVSSSSSIPKSKGAYSWVEHSSSTDVAATSSSFAKCEPAISPASSSFKSDERKSKYIPISLPNLSSSTYQPGKSLKPPPVSAKPTISLAPSFSTSTNYKWIKKNASSSYVFPKEIKSSIDQDIVPGVLKMSLSKSSYKDYFYALLYAEDCYFEKWDGFEIKNVKVELREAIIDPRRGKDRSLKYGKEKFFVAFELDKIRERRPFLISRDSVYLQPADQKIKPFKGVMYRVINHNLVLADFGEEFFSQHHPDDKYDVKFSFNRFCLKRAHQAIKAASESLIDNLLFPNILPKYKISQKDPLAVGEILRLQGLPPYLVQGPLAAVYDKLSKTGELVIEAITQILRADPSKKILLCAPLLMRGLKNKKAIAESEMFRANAAYREVDGVPEDILSSCSYTDDTECFVCPEFSKLRKYKVISTTYTSSYMLYGEGIKAGYFSHIFMVDASSATEPEAMIPLANFVTAKTVVILTGDPGNHSRWIRSKIARDNGLLTSYFERLNDSAIPEA